MSLIEIMNEVANKLITNEEFHNTSVHTSILKNCRLRNCRLYNCTTINCYLTNTETDKQCTVILSDDWIQKELTKIYQEKEADIVEMADEYFRREFLGNLTNAVLDGLIDDVKSDFEELRETGHLRSKIGELIATSERYIDRLDRELTEETFEFLRQDFMDMFEHKVGMIFTNRVGNSYKPIFTREGHRKMRRVLIDLTSTRQPRKSDIHTVIAVIDEVIPEYDLDEMVESVCDILT